MAIGNGGGGTQGRITAITVRGTGINPFTPEETGHEAALDDAFTATRDALHTNPSANITTLVTAYKEEIESAFGVTFMKDIANPQIASDWGVVSLHFARCGLEATAEAFEKWVEAQILTQSLCKSVDRYALFRRITGGLTLNNSAAEADHVALTAGKIINVYRVPSGNRQWVMTPNNLIHEIGHSFSRAAGYDTLKLGSIEQAVDNTSLVAGYTRDGMGPEYLRIGITPGNYSTLRYIHADVVDNNGVASFDPVPNAPTLPPDSYLLYDLFGTKYALWNSGLNLYGLSARVDILVHNWPASTESNDVKLREIVADAFLNWVRGSFEGTAGTAWQNFFEQNVGKFMRNAAIYWGGMSSHYVQNGIIRSTQTDTRDFIQVLNSESQLVWANLRLNPVESDSTNLIGAATISGRIPLSSKIYGWWQQTTTSDIWLLVDSQPTDGKRLAWVIANGVDLESNDLVDDPPPQGNRIGNYDLLNPGRAFSASDLSTLLE